MKRDPPVPTLIRHAYPITVVGAEVYLVSIVEKRLEELPGPIVSGFDLPVPRHRWWSVAEQE
jgi:hypothetical protein